MNIEELYNKILREHSTNPHNYSSGLRKIPESVQRENPSCGDWICLLARFDASDGLETINFEIEGCSIATASSSIMTEIVKGKKRQEVKKICQEILSVMKGEKEGAFLDSYGDIAALKGVLPFPYRLKCAALPWQALEMV